MVFIMRDLGIEKTIKVTQPCLGKKKDTSEQLYQEQIKLTTVVFVHHLARYNCAEENIFCALSRPKSPMTFKLAQL